MFGKAGFKSGNCPNFTMDSSGNKICNGKTSNKYDDYYFDSNGKKIFTARYGGNPLKKEYVVTGVMKSSPLKIIKTKNANRKFLDRATKKDNFGNTSK